MALRVAFDLDGTIADMHASLRQVADALFGSREEPPTQPEHAALGGDEPETKSVLAELPLTTQQQMQLWDHVRTIENFWRGLAELTPGIVARIAKASEARRWEVIFLTTRPAVAGDTVQVQSQRWLVAHGFPLPSVYVVHRSRGRIADALQLDAVVDDRPENCLDVAVESKATPILIWPGDLQHVPTGAKRLGIRIARSISDAVDMLEAMDDMRKESRLTRSLRKWFRKETPA
jgi:hypothetical protein